MPVAMSKRDRPRVAKAVCVCHDKTEWKSCHGEVTVIVCCAESERSGGECNREEGGSGRRAKSVEKRTKRQRSLK